MTSRGKSLRELAALAPRVPGQVENLSYRRRAAFTLIELMIVVVIAIILMAVTLPTIKYSIEEGKVREAARQINAFFASAKAHATATGRHGGVWLELERIGDPTTPLGVYQCSQIYLAEVPAPYGGDYLNSRAVVRNAIGDTNALDPTASAWLLDFADSPGMPPEPLNAPSVASLMADPGGLIKRGESFGIRFDNKGFLFGGFRSTSDGRLYIKNPQNGLIPPRANGLPSGTNPGAGYSFQIFRQPQRIGQPLEFPQGVVLDMSYSGVSPTGYQFEAAKERVLVMFSPTGGVSSVSFVHQQTGNVVEDSESSKLFLLVGRTENMENGPAWTNVAASNLVNGANLWVAVNRRTGSVATVENVPDINPNSYNPPQPFPPTTLQQRQNFLARAREFAAKGDVKGGQ